jgi:hypothetical protein
MTPRILAAIAALLSALTRLRLDIFAAKIVSFVLLLATVHPEALAAALLAAVCTAITLLVALIARNLLRDGLRPHPRTA